MKPLFYLTTTIGLFITLTSCCTKKDCEGFGDEFYLSGFVYADVDSISVETFKSNTNFTNRTDSLFTRANDWGSTEYSAYLKKNLDVTLDYKITLLSTKQVYKISGFEIGRVTCNKCFPYHPANDYVDSLEGYFLNGQKKQNYRIKISK